MTNLQAYIFLSLLNILVYIKSLGDTFTLKFLYNNKNSTPMINGKIPINSMNIYPKITSPVDSENKRITIDRAILNKPMIIKVIPKFLE